MPEKNLSFFEMFAPYGIWVLFILSYASSFDILGTVVTAIETPFALAIGAVCNLISMPFG